MSRELFGTVTKRHGNYFVVECPDAPDHLKVLYLLPREVAGAAIGDAVRLVYITTPSMGAWVVSRQENGVD